METKNISIGIITDVHYTDRERIGNRYCRDSLSKVREAIQAFEALKPSFIIHLGDFIDSGEIHGHEIDYLQTIDSEYKKFNGEKHYVIGNHDVADLSKDQFLDICGKGRHYSFDREGFHFIILDACYNEDESDYDSGNFDWIESYIPIFEQEWLKLDIENTEKMIFIFIHQRLDDEKNVHGVKNAIPIRKILEESGKVIAVFQGHDHQGEYRLINGIHYLTFQAVVEGERIENNAYSLIQIKDDGTAIIKCFGRKRQNLHLAKDGLK